MSHNEHRVVSSGKCALFSKRNKNKVPRAGFVRISRRPNLAEAFTGIYETDIRIHVREKETPRTEKRPATRKSFQTDSCFFLNSFFFFYPLVVIITISPVVVVCKPMYMLYINVDGKEISENDYNIKDLRFDFFFVFTFFFIPTTHGPAHCLLVVFFLQDDGVSV